MSLKSGIKITIILLLTGVTIFIIFLMVYTTNETVDTRLYTVGILIREQDSLVPLNNIIEKEKKNLGEEIELQFKIREFKDDNGLLAEGVLLLKSSYDLVLLIGETDIPPPLKSLYPNDNIRLINNEAESPSLKEAIHEAISQWKSSIETQNHEETR